MADWQKVSGSKEYKALSDEDKDAVRADFFDRSVAPSLNADDVPSIRSDFMERTKPTFIGKVADAASNAVDNLKSVFTPSADKSTSAAPKPAAASGVTALGKSAPAAPAVTPYDFGALDGNKPAPAPIATSTQSTIDSVKTPDEKAAEAAAAVQVPALTKDNGFAKAGQQYMADQNAAGQNAALARWQTEQSQQRDQKQEQDSRSLPGNLFDFAKDTALTTLGLESDQSASTGGDIGRQLGRGIQVDIPQTAVGMSEAAGDAEQRAPAFGALAISKIATLLTPQFITDARNSADQWINKQLNDRSQSISDELTQSGKASASKKYFQDGTSYSELKKGSDGSDSVANIPGNIAGMVSDGKFFGNAWSDPKAVAGSALESAPVSLISMLPVMRGAKMAHDMAMAKALEAGATEAAAKETATAAATKTASILGGTSEGVTGAGQQWQQTYQQVADMDQGKLDASPEYQKALTQFNGDKSKARDLIARHAADTAAVVAGVSDALFASVGDRYIGGAVSGKYGRLGSVGMGVLEETPTETLQSGAEQFGTNLGVQQNADPSQSLTDQVGEQAVQGGISGGLMGGVMGGGSHEGANMHPQAAGAAAADAAKADALAKWKSAFNPAPRPIGTLERAATIAAQNGLTQQAATDLAPKPAPTGKAALDATELLDTEGAPNAGGQTAEPAVAGNQAGGNEPAGSAGTEPVGQPAQRVEPAGAPDTGSGTPMAAGITLQPGDALTTPAIDEAAHEAATSPLNDNPEPTDAQKEAGNYKKGHVTLHGLDISIENPAGSTRSGVDENGKAWETQLANHYGYVKGSTGADGDQVDVFIGSKPESQNVYVVDQINPKTGKFDEHKALLGFGSLHEALDAYHSNYQQGWKGAGNVTAMSVGKFKDWLKNGDTTKPLASGEQSGKSETQAALSATDDAQPIARVGTTPKNTEDVTVKNGVVHLGKYPAQNFETGEDITVDEPTFEAVSKALRDGGALSNKQRIYGGTAAPTEAKGANPFKRAFETMTAGSMPQGVKDPEQAKSAFDAGLIKTAGDLRRFEENGYPQPKQPKAKAPKAIIPAKTADEFADRSRKQFIKTIKDMGGISVTESKDVTGEPAHIANRMAPGLFRTGGNALDLVARRMNEAGYLSDEHYNDVDGGVQAVRDLVRQALAKEPVIAVQDQDRYHELMAQEQRLAEQEHALAEQMPAHDETLAEILADEEGDLPDFGAGTTDTAESMRAMGFTEDEINAQLKKEQGAEAAGGTSAGSPGEGHQAGQGQEATQGSQGQDSGFALQHQSEAELAAADQTAKQKAEDKAKADATAEAKRKADAERGDFTLTGSDRASDANSNQGDIFSQPAGHEPVGHDGKRQSDRDASKLESHAGEFTMQAESDIRNGETPDAMALVRSAKAWSQSNGINSNQFRQAVYKKMRASDTPALRGMADDFLRGNMPEKKSVTPQVPTGDMEKYIKVAADSIKDLRKVDVYRVLVESNRAEFRQAIANYIKDKRPDLAAEVDAVMAEAAAEQNAKPSLSGGKSASWVIRNKATGEVVMETFDKAKVDALNTDKYEAIPIQEHLASLNKPVTTDSPFDSAAWDKARDDRIAASKGSGNRHLDDVTPSVETMRGKEIYYAHDQKQRGVIRTVDNRGNVYVYWANEYSANKEMASEAVEDNKSWLKSSRGLPYMRSERNGKTYVMQSSLGPTDLKDYVFAGEAGQEKPKESEAPAWHTTLPESGQPITEQQAKNYALIPNAVASEGYDALRRDQLLAGGQWYAYMLPANGRNNGVVRLVPEDQTAPKPWKLVNSEGIRIGGMTRDQVVARLADWLRREPILGDPSVQENPASTEREQAAKPNESSDQPKQGKIGMMLGSGEVVLTASGRETTPFPKVKTGPRNTSITLKAADKWLMQNALDEANSRGDSYNARMFEAALDKPQQADKDSAEEYLFGHQPDVVPSILKPLTPSKPNAADSIGWGGMTTEQREELVKQAGWTAGKDNHISATGKRIAAAAWDGLETQTRLTLKSYAENGRGMTQAEHQAALGHTTADQLDTEYRLNPVEIHEALDRRGDLSALYKAAGVRNADTFDGLPMDERASAYAKFVQDGGKPVEITEDYNTKVARMEHEAEVRRKQSTREIAQANGKPFKTEQSAQKVRDEFDLNITHRIDAKDGGFVLALRPPAHQAEEQRKADGKLSYQEAQDAVVKEMGLGETKDGEVDATDEQWKEIERRTDEMLGKQDGRTPTIEQRHAELDKKVDALTDDEAVKVGGAIGIKYKRGEDIRAKIKEAHPDDQEKGLAALGQSSKPNGGIKFNEQLDGFAEQLNVARAAYGEDNANSLFNKIIKDNFLTKDEANTLAKRADEMRDSRKPASKLDAAAASIDAELDSALDDLAAALKNQGSQLNSGVDPKILALGVKVGSLYVAKGVVKFAQYSRAVLDALRSRGVDPEHLKPYLKQFYAATKQEVDDATFDKMDDDRTVRGFDLSSLDSAKPGLPDGWDESQPGGMVTNSDPVNGGIVDTEIASGKWFAVSNNKQIGTLDGFATRDDALAALASAVKAATIGKTGENNVTDQRSGTRLEPDSQDAATQDGMGEKDVRAGRAEDGGTGGPGVQDTEGEGGAGSGGLISGYETAPFGERGDLEIYTGGTRVSAGTAGGSVDSRGGEAGVDGPPIEPEATDLFGELAESGLSQVAAKQAQVKADRQEHKPGLANIRETLPVLTEGQQEDVHKTETRFSVPDGYGMLFTNGTGTGKTFTGLGVIKRHVTAGKGNILVVAPNDKIIEDWQKSGELLALKLNRLADTNDAGSGVVITTYANMGQNDALASRDWDLIVHDEAHYLAMDKDGTNTNALKTLRAISLHPDGAYLRTQMQNRALVDRMHELSQMLSNQDTPTEHSAAYEDELKKLSAEWNAKLDAVKNDVSARQGEARTRALFLSATPFAYEKTVDWANGYLFDYNEGRASEEGNFRGYNQGSNRDQFFMQHFGYRMRTNKLSEPDAKVDRGLMQRQFNGWLKKSGALSGRMLDVKADYDRRFVLVDSAIGTRIDEALQWFDDKRKERAAANNPTGNPQSLASYKPDPKSEAMRALRDIIAEKFDYLSRRYLLEAIKAREVIPHVREHLALGRKVVVFHDYKKGGGFNPFNIVPRSAPDSDAGGERTAALNEVIGEFRREFRDLIESDVWSASSPITAFQREFPNALLFNGDVPSKQRRANVAKFQDDASGPQVMLVQSAAGKEGISLHDTTGKHQRVLFNLGQPTQPTTAIQQEGRIYRTGQVTDAIFRYLNTGTNWEKWAFATTIAHRASTAENLGMGELARALKDAFIAGFEESGDYRAGMEGEGKGGKERDRAANDAITEYDRARAFYYGTQKKNSKTKAQEGADYFATPEPLGLKMVEWANMRPGEDFLEPSAGHGAIARWAPDDAVKTGIEPSSALRPRLAMVFDGKIVDSTFEDLNIVNKYDAIVMNPPFGSGGRTAIDHVAKAAQHLRDGGRIVALIPTGPAADKKFEKWFYEEEQRAVKPLFDHPTLGPIYKGDTVTTRAGWLPKGVVTRRDTAGNFWFKRDANSETMVSPEAWTSVEKTGPRTGTYRPAANLYLAGEIRLPQVTFERAGTAVATRVVVIEKQTDKDLAARIQQANRDLSGETDINDLFNRLENVSLPDRTKPAEDAPAAAVATPAKPKKEAVDPVAAQAAASDMGLNIIEHTTGKGKVIRGVVRTDLTKDQAKAIDEFTFRKDGGYFIREKHLAKMQGGDTAFSRDSLGVAEPAGRFTPILQRELDDVVKRVASGWVRSQGLDGRRIVSVDRPANLPAAILRAADAQNVPHDEIKGVLHNGHVYLVRENLKDAKDAELTIFHEAFGHLGARLMLGPDAEAVQKAFVALWNRIGALDGVRKMAGRFGVLDQVEPYIRAIQTADLPLEMKQKIIMDELLAHVAGRGNFTLKEQAKAYLGALRVGLRNAARAMGLKGIAQTLDAYTDNELLWNLKQMRAAVINGGSGPGGGTLFSRQAAIPDTTTEQAPQLTRQTPLDMPPGFAGNQASWDAPENTGFDNFVYKLQDKHIDTKRVIAAVQKTGKALADKWNPYLQEELFHGRAAKRTLDFVDRELNPLLHEAQAAKLSLDDIDQYLHARHAEEANDLIASRDPAMPDGGSGMTTADARAYMAALPADKARDLAAIAAKVDAILANTRQLYADYGLESQDTVDEWGQMFKHYVPLMREDKGGGMGIGQGFSIKGREVKHRTGSTRAVVDILANIAMQREKVIVRGEKNRVAVSLAGLAKLNPNKDFWTFDKVPTERVLNEDTGLVETRANPMFKSRPNVIVAKIKGKGGQIEERAIVFNERDERAMRMVQALKNLDMNQLDGLMGTLAKVTRYFSAINTQYNPVFGFVNLTRDIQDAAINLGSTPLKGKRAAIVANTFSALSGIYRDVRAERRGGMASSKWAHLWEEFNLEGGQTGYRDLYATSADRAKAIQRALNPTAWMDSKLGKVFTAGGVLKVPLAVAQKQAGWIFDWLSDFNETMENATRLASYKVGLEQGMSKQQAASLAKNLTVNFNRKGQASQQAGALYAFFNASMQGTARMGALLTKMENGNLKTLRLSGAGMKIIGGGVMLGAMQAAMLAAAGFGDDDPPEFVRQNNLIIPLTPVSGKKNYMMIPMPLGYRVFPNIGRILTEVAMHGGKDAGKRIFDIMGIMADAFDPLGGSGLSLQTVSPTVLDPAVNLATNQDWTGKPIYREDFNHNDPTPGFTRTKDTATSYAKALAEAINYATGGDDYNPGKYSPTPDQIDYLVAQVTGGVGRELGKAEQTVSSMSSGEDMPTYKIPLAGRFYGSSDGQASQASRFYENLQRANAYGNEIKGRRRDGKDVGEYLDANPDAQQMMMAGRQAESRIKELRQRKLKLVREGADRSEVKDIEARITEVMTDFNEQAAQAQ